MTGYCKLCRERFSLPPEAVSGVVLHFGAQADRLLFQGMTGGMVSHLSKYHREEFQRLQPLALAIQGWLASFLIEDGEAAETSRFKREQTNVGQEIRALINSDEPVVVNKVQPAAAGAAPNQI